MVITIMAMKKLTLAITAEMDSALEKERRKRLLDSVPETIRMILSEYLSQRPEHKT